MRYEPTFWENGKTPLNDDNLNKIETGLSNLSENVEELNSTVENLSTNTENLSSTVENLSNTMEGDLSEVKEDIEELKNKVDVDITEGSTTTLTNSFDGGLRFNEMLGKSEQNGTPTPSAPSSIKSVKGKNLVKIGAKSQKVNDVDFTINNDGSVKIVGVPSTHTFFNMVATIDLKPSTSYIFSGCNTKSSIFMLRLRTFNKNGDVLNTYLCYDGEVKFTTESDFDRADLYIGFYTTYGTANTTFYPMVRLASITDSTYVPYGVVELKTQSKNLCNGINQGLFINMGCTKAGTNNTDSGLAIKVDGGTYTVSTKVVQDRFRVACSNVISSEFDCFNGRNRDNKLDSATVDCTGYSYLIVNATDLSAIQIEKSNTATPFQPYQESFAYLSDIDLNGINGLKDRLIRKDGLWQIERKVGKTVFDGSSDETWGVYVDASVGARFFAYRENITDLSNAQYMTAISTHHEMHPKGYTDNTPNTVIVRRQGEYYTFDLNFEVGFIANNSIDNFRTWLASNNVTVIYERATPTYEVLPTADQIALNSLLTFDCVTYLSIESELEPQFTLEYGTSKVGGYTLKSLNTAEANTARLNAIETLTSNLATAIL